jgi:hypothetical protein
MSDRHDRQRVQPTVEGRARLLAAVDAAGAPHVVDAGALGEYAETIVLRGRTDANAAFPEVAAHLSAGCAPCNDDLKELLALAAEPDPAPQPASPSPPSPAKPSPSQGEGWVGVHSSLSEGLVGVPPRSQRPDESGIYAADLPDVRADEEAARRKRLRKWRDWLLVAAAASILLIGLSLVGMAYLASQRPEARLGLTPQGAPGASPATQTGRAAPNGMDCPAAYPIKGNRTSMIFHLPGGEFYDQTRPEDCFASPADAEAASYRKSQR